MKKTTAPRPILQFALLFFILLLAAWLRFSCLTCSSLWHDEGNAWALAQRTVAQIARDAAADIHPPGYYWLLKLWAGLFGGSAWGIRSFSASAALLTVAVVYRIGLEIGRGTMKRRSLFALLAAFLAALSPFQIFYGQEARMYALLMLESAALFWALLGMKGRWAARGGRAEGWLYGVVYLLAAMTGLWTHYFFAVALAAAGGLLPGGGGLGGQRSANPRGSMNGRRPSIATRTRHAAAIGKIPGCPSSHSSRSAPWLSSVICPGCQRQSNDC